MRFPPIDSLRFWESPAPESPSTGATSAVKDRQQRIKEKQVNHGYETVTTASGEEVKKRRKVFRTSEQFPGTDRFLPVRYVGTTQDGKPIKAWEIGTDYLLWTVGETKSDRVAVVAHGAYPNYSGDVRVPDGTNLFGPHKAELEAGEHLEEVKEVITTAEHERFHYATVENNGVIRKARHAQDKSSKEITGSNIPQHIRNLELQKMGSYDEISEWLKQNRALASEHHCDILTIRTKPATDALMLAVSPIVLPAFKLAGRIGAPQPTTGSTSTKKLFKELQKLGIHFAKTDLIFCRSKYLDHSTKYPLHSESPPPKLPDVPIGGDGLLDSFKEEFPDTREYPQSPP